MEEESLALIALYRRYKMKKKKKRTQYVRPLNINRQISGEYCSLLRDIWDVDDIKIHHQYFRMSRARFLDLVERLRPKIARGPTHRSPIDVPERVAITLRILASGCSQQSVAETFRVGKSTVNKIFYETCAAIWSVLQEEFLKFPDEDSWKTIAEEFGSFWNFPLCVGAIDGKHITIRAPANSGSDFFNYKHTHSMVLLAVVDARYCFSMISVGSYGRESDSGIFSRSVFGQQLNDGTLGIPPPTELPRTTKTSPYVFVGDEAFPLKENLMRPFPGKFITNHNYFFYHACSYHYVHTSRLVIFMQIILCFALLGTGLDLRRRVFNYRLSRARRIAENAFGILRARWRILARPIDCKPENVNHIVKASVVLHNYLKRTDNVSTPASQYSMSDQAWRAVVDADTNVLPVGRLGSNMNSASAREIRENFANYFSSPQGSVPWQESLVQRGSLPDN